MRIFYASDTTPNPSFQSNLWHNNLYQPLVDLGHEVVEFDYDLRETFLHLDPAYEDHRRFIEHNRPQVTRELLRQIRAAHRERPLDLFFSYFSDACVLPEGIEEIKSLGIKTVNWYCNGSYQLHLVAEIAPHYDWCLVPEKFRLPDYLAMGARPIYCQEAANPDIYKPHDLPREFDVVFVGQAYGERPAYIRHLLDQGIDVRVWGFGWEQYAAGAAKWLNASVWRRYGHIARRLLTAEGRRRAATRLAEGPGPVRIPAAAVGGVLSDAEMIRLYSRAKINLGFSACGNTHQSERRIVQVRLRDFEVPMSGGFYMVEYMEELEEFYDIGREIVCYSGPEDLAEKAAYYLAHDAERERIRQAGHARCRRDHTWHKRFTDAFREMGLN